MKIIKIHGRGPGASVFRRSKNGVVLEGIKAKKMANGSTALMFVLKNAQLSLILSEDEYDKLKSHLD